MGSAEDWVVSDDPNISEDGVVVAEPNTPPRTHRTPRWMWMGSAAVGDERGPLRCCRGRGDVEVAPPNPLLQVCGWLMDAAVVARGSREGGCGWSSSVVWRWGSDGAVAEMELEMEGGSSSAVDGKKMTLVVM